jgi:hypothetical protein
MKNFFRSIFHRQELKKLQICQKHIKFDAEGKKLVPINSAVPYTKDYCNTCYEHLCYSCA